MKNDFSSWEFKIDHGTHSEIQKHLNQWKHEFELNIIHVHFWEQGYTTIFLARRRIS